MPEKKNIYQKFPFVRITLFFVIGIILGKYFIIQSSFLFAFVVLFFLIFLIGWNNSTFNFVSIQNKILPLLIICTGFLYSQVFKEEQVALTPSNNYYIAEVCQKPIEKKNTYQSILKIKNDSLKHPQKVLVYFSKSNFDTTINSGDLLLVFCNISKIRNMGNPYEFDYKGMMNNRNMFFTAYIPPGKYIKTKYTSSSIKYFAERIRDKLLLKIKLFISENRERSVISALTLGYRTELDRETTDYFTSTGAMHVLAVSGLHVGLIYFILCFLFDWVKRLSIGLIVFPLTIIISLWIYALIAGFSPSVQRATVMFTFVVLGNSMRRPVNFYNSLTASAVVLILFQPNVIYEVGFQLSYLAVFGIVLIQPKIAGLLVVNNKIIKFFWDLLTVSIAAQIATLPIGLYYFNQFPNYFWLSNFLVIPGATIIIWLTFSLLVFNKVDIISDVLADILQFITKSMIDSLKFISELPNALSEGIIINAFQLILLYLLFVLFGTYLLSKKKIWLINSLIIIIVFQTSIVYNKLNLLNNKQLIYYNSPSHILHYINGRQNYIVLENEIDLSEHEKNMIQTVLNNLNLAEPKKLFLSENYESDDLILKRNIIYFLNSETKLNKTSKSNVKRNSLINFSYSNNSINKKDLANINNASHKSVYQHVEINKRECFVFDYN